ncbi:hypothetical protein E2C01_015577 [Portunus trituberculatus]|uniref:Uncharacterized protein n=1 Tax=Portunus trituberculatus TaxID=210409 RepID=A0A5B7DM21_PORTR|nr:hypothetical protein [Portunus trituberculatus]
MVKSSDEDAFAPLTCHRLPSEVFFSFSHLYVSAFVWVGQHGEGRTLAQLMDVITLREELKHILFCHRGQGAGEGGGEKLVVIVVSWGLAVDGVVFLRFGCLRQNHLPSFFLTVSVEKSQNSVVVFFTLSR